jgi:hypothetical protein
MPFSGQALRDAKDQRSDDAPPDGRYDVELVESRIVQANSDGRSWLILTWRVLAGAQRDEQWDSLHTIDQYDRNGDPNPGLGITVQSLDAMGVDLDNVDGDVDLQRALRAMYGRGFDVEVKRKPPYTNTYVRGVMVGVGVNATQQGESPPSTGYGHPPDKSSTPETIASSSQGANAILGGDVPERAPSLREQAAAAQSPQRTGESDVTPRGATDAFKTGEPQTQGDDVPWETHEPPKRGDPNPETGEPFLY